MSPPEASATHTSMVFGDFRYKWITKFDEEGDGAEGEERKWHLVEDNLKVFIIAAPF
jgi:hypothetical protein